MQLRLGSAVVSTAVFGVPPKTSAPYEHSPNGPSSRASDWLAGRQERVGPSHDSHRRHETPENKAERTVKEELKQIGWSRVDLASRAKGSPEKVAIAARLRKETTMTLQWIATRLNMGTWTHVSNLLSAKAKTPNE
jgi:hypothetical protein